jgi:hypothetical protein|tara:strand:- start:885 stop:1145 length:261 start_codon:yes stop_codon:yes gene_type:complete
MEQEKQESYYDYMARRNKEEDERLDKLLFGEVEKGQSFTVKVVEGENGDLVLPIPTELLNQMGWDIGDNLLWEDSFNSSFILKKAP